MRVVLDECVPKRLGAHLANYEVKTVPQIGLAGVKNKELLRRLSGVCDVFVAVDRNLPSQQNVANLSFAILVLRARSNRIAELAGLVPQIVASLEGLRPGQALVVG